MHYLQPRIPLQFPFETATCFTVFLENGSSFLSADFKGAQRTERTVRPKKTAPKFALCTHQLHAHRRQAEAVADALPVNAPTLSNEVRRPLCLLVRWTVA